MIARAPTVAGLAALLVAWGALPWLGWPPFTTHMSQHMLVVALAAPLLAAGLAGSRLDPVPRWPVATNAIAASMLELVVVWAWHAPSLHRIARATGWGRGLEQGSFLVSGLYLWMAALGGGERRRRERAAAGVAGLLLTSMHMTLLGALLTLADRPLFHHGGHGAQGGLSVTHDQQLGGAIMLVAGAAAYLAGGSWLAAKAFGPRLRGPAAEVER